MGLVFDLYGNPLFTAGTHIDSGPENSATHSSSVGSAIKPGSYGGYTDKIHTDKTSLARDNRAVTDSHGNVVGYHIDARPGDISAWQEGKHTFRSVGGVCRLLADAAGVYLADADGKLLLA